MKKNCHTCKHLEWADDDSADGHPGNSGWCCNKRDDGGANVALLRDLARDSYLLRGKVCHEPKE